MASPWRTLQIRWMDFSAIRTAGQPPSTSECTTFSGEARALLVSHTTSGILSLSRATGGEEPAGVYGTTSVHHEGGEGLDAEGVLLRVVRELHEFPWTPAHSTTAARRA